MLFLVNTLHLKYRIYGYDNVKCKSIFRFGPIHIPIFSSWLLQLLIPYLCYFLWPSSAALTFTFYPTSKISISLSHLRTYAFCMKGKIIAVFMLHNRTNLLSVLIS